MNGSHADMLDDVAVYALGTLPHTEAERVRAHIENCAECRAEYEALAPAVSAVAQSAEASADGANGAIHASPLLKARIMREVRTSDRAPKLWPSYAFAAACLAIALGLAGQNLSLTRTLHTAEISQSHVTSTRPIDEQTLADLVDQRAKRYRVPGGEIVRSNNRLYIAMDDMPQPPRGKVYQAWTERKGSKTMNPGATFVPDRHGVAILPVSSEARALHAVAVSVEPPGGSKAPTTSPVVLELLE